MRCGVGAFAGGEAHEFLRLMPHAVAMDFLAQPAEQRAVFAARQLSFERRTIRLRPAHKLRGVQIAQRIGREIAHRADAPVDVLQAAVGVLGDLQAEGFLKLLVPIRRHVGHGELALDQFHLDLKAQDDMQIIGDLVRLDPDEGWLDVVYRTRDLRGREPAQFRKMFACDGMPVLPEGFAPADVIFPEPRLRFMDAERNRLPKWCSVMFGRQSLIVKPVASLVHDAIKRLREIGLVVTRGEPAVVQTQPAAKWMRRGVNPSRGKIKTHRLRHLEVERLLFGDGIMPVQDRTRRGGGALHRRSENGDDFRPQPGEQFAQILGARAGFIVVEMRVVWGTGIAPQPGELQVQIHQFLEMRPENFEFRFLAGLAPGSTGVGAEALEFFHQTRRDFRLAIMAAAPFADVGRLGGAGRKTVLLAFGNPFPDFFGGEKPVCLPAEVRHLPGAIIKRLGRHVGFLVPRQQAVGAVEERDFAGAFEQLVVGGKSVRHETSL